VVSFIGQISASFERITAWTIDEICLISRVGERPFEVRHTVKLSGTAVIPRSLEASGGLPKYSDGEIPLRVDGKIVQQVEQNIQREKPPEFPFEPKKFLPKITKSIKKWITNPNHKNHLPRKKDAFLNSIQPFSHVRLQALSEDYVVQKLVAENFIEIDSDGDVFLVDRKFTEFPPAGKDLPYHFTHDLQPAQLEVLRKNIEWVTSLSHPPGSVETLKSAVNQLCFHTFTVEISTIVEEITRKKLVIFDGDKVRYFNAGNKTATKPDNSDASNNTDEQDKTIT